MVLGAAIGGAVPNVPAWQAGYDSNSVGGVLGAMLEPVHGFGKFLLVLMALSMLGNVSGSVYALTLNFKRPCTLYAYAFHVLSMLSCPPLSSFQSP